MLRRGFDQLSLGNPVGRESNGRRDPLADDDGGDLRLYSRRRAIDDRHGY